MPNWEKQNPERKQYDDESIIKAVSEVFEKVNGDYTITEYRNHRDGSHPSYPTINNRFDSWDDAKEKAEITESDDDTISESEQTGEEDDSSSKESSAEYTRSDCMRAVRNVFESIAGNTITASEYVSNREHSHPDINVLSEKFQDWEEVIAEAGITVRVTREECVQGITFVADKIREPPEKQEYDSHKLPEHPSSELIETQYGYWSDALEDANVV